MLHVLGMADEPRGCEAVAAAVAVAVAGGPAYLHLVCTPMHLLRQGPSLSLG